MGLRISWKNRNTETLRFHVLELGERVQRDFFGDLHCFGDEILGEAPPGVLYLGPLRTGNDTLEVVIDKTMIAAQNVERFLLDCGLKVTPASADPQ